ncbi:MAG: hypothetical protein DNFNHJIP_00279 [Candidatus Argoarchaeum ethanivorans]|uniref:Uncharacterized protein n=1 Tax=Candidatus Argoarchaeum ethanivorans TaxID=2608793 RepID=A0A812A035_9EURY|nr:MAG: hypothetical protein DNFNHJIP_00279 [Candidatus Argoarchaeum ethanivorans]
MDLEVVEKYIGAQSYVQKEKTLTSPVPISTGYSDLSRCIKK